MWDTETCFCSLFLSLSLSLPKEELEESCHFFSLNSKYIGGFKRHDYVEELRKITLMTTERSWGSHGHPLYFIAEKAEAKREDGK